MKQQTQNPNSGLNLGNPRMIASKPSFTARFFFYFFVLILGISSACGCFFTVFRVPVSLQAVTWCIVLFSAAFTAIFLLKRGRALLFLLALCLSSLLLLVDAFRENLIQGFTRTVNTIIFAYIEKTGLDFLYLSAKPASIKEITASCTVFWIFLLFFIIFLMAWLLIRRKNTFLCFLLTVPFLAVSLAFTIIPHYAAVAGLLIFWSFLLMNSTFQRRKNGFVRKRNVFYGDGNMAEHPNSFMILPLLAICLMLPILLFPMQSFQRSDLVEDLRSGLINRPSLSSLFRSGGIAGNTNRVNLQLAGDIEFTGETVLRVKSSKEDSEYLKGFVGGIYTGQSWEALPEEDYQQLDDILGGRQVQNFPFLFTNLLYCDIDGNIYEYDITVQNVGGNPRSIYTPYGLISDSKALTDLEFVNDGFLRSGNSVFGTKEYSMRAINLQTFHQYTTFYYRLANRFSANSGENSLAALDLNKDLHGGFNNSIRQMDEWTMPDELIELLNPAQASFAKAAQGYTNFVYSHYTQLPDELEEKLDQYRRERDLDTEHYPWPRLLASAIINQVHGENTYTLSPGLTPDGSDFVEYFLFENHKGYCMHFASATVVLLRSAGIPARYVEGYTVSPNDFTGSDGWADIPDSRAHAWAEIYLSGVGWIPVEATPGAANAAITPETSGSDSIDETESESEDTVNSSEEPQEEETSGEVSSETQISDEVDESGTSPGESGNFIVNALFLILFILAAIGLLMSVLAINRKLRIGLRNKRFRQEDHNEAVMAIYDYIIKLLPYTFIDEIPEELYELVLKARFSQHMLTRQDVYELQGYAGELANEVREKASVSRRFIYKYVYVLF